MRFPARRPAVALVLAASVGMACSLGSFTGYSSGGGDDAGADATADGEGDSGKIDAALPDGGAPSDGGVDDGGACKAVFCDDFEKAGAIDVGWDNLVAESGGQLTEAKSPLPVHAGTRAVRVHVPIGPSSRAYLRKKLTGTTKHATYSFWMNLPAPGRVLQVARVELLALDGTAGLYILQTKSTGGLLVAEQYYDGASYGGFVARELSAFQPGVWQQWTLEIDATVTPPHGKVYVGGMLVVDDVLTNPFAAGVVQVHLGATFVDDGPDIVYFVDDVAVDFVP